MNPNCWLCGQVIAPRRWWRLLDPLVHATPDEECPVITEKRARVEADLFDLGDEEMVRAYTERVWRS